MVIYTLCLFNDLSYVKLGAGALFEPAENLNKVMSLEVDGKPLPVPDVSG